MGEKILGPGESLPTEWPVAGSTGYEFTNSSARLFVDVPGLLHLHSHYIRKIDNRWERFHDCVYDSKREMLESHFVSELSYLVDQFHVMASKSLSAGGIFTKEDLRETLIELISSLEVYRSYAIRGQPLQSRWLENAFAEAEGRGKLATKEAFNWLREIFLNPAGDWSEEVYLNIKRFEQLTGR